MPLEPYTNKYSNWVLKKMSICGIIYLGVYIWHPVYLLRRAIYTTYANLFCNEFWR